MSKEKPEFHPAMRKACFQYLCNVKWPDGFKCPICGHRHCYVIGGYRRFQCAKCHHQTSLTANTVMHRSHLPLHKWFWRSICWLVTSVVFRPWRWQEKLRCATKPHGISCNASGKLCRRGMSAMCLDELWSLMCLYSGAKDKGCLGDGELEIRAFLSLLPRMRRANRLS